jgi:hypothetical protein
MQRQVIKVNNVKFYSGAVGAIRFVATKRGVVKCIPRVNTAAELPVIRVKQYRDTNKFEASVSFVKGAEVFVTARNPNKAFRKAVRAYWQDQ